MWRELAAQVEMLGVYSPAFYSSFALMVSTLTEAKYPDPREPATARVKLLTTASSLLQRFGLDPASVGRVSALKAEKASGDEAVPVLGLAPTPTPDHLDA
jgi:hypothetical protein